MIGAPHGHLHRTRMELLLQPEIWVALATLTALEIVLGIDNIIFISILASKLPAEQQEKARRLGLGAAMLSRILLLFSLSWIMKLTAPLFSVLGEEISGRDLILIGGGLFLTAKSVFEIHERLEGEDQHASAARQAASFGSVIVQIMILDIVFSLDSVITAVGLTPHLPVMITAVVISVGFMMFFAGPVSRFVDAHPTLKVLALSFLILIGFALIGEGAGLHIPKGYIYFSMAFAFCVEMINLRVRSRRQPLLLHNRFNDSETPAQASDSKR